MQYMFGTGYLSLTPPVGSSDMTPTQVGLLRDISIDISFTTKELKGQNIYPVDIARAGAKIGGKAKSAIINGGMIQAILGGTSTTGQTVGYQETMSASATTYTATNGANFVDDLGVVNSSGVQVPKVASGPTGNQYAVTAAGVYTFGTAGIYTVTYSATVSAQGKTIKLINTLMGGSTVYSVRLFNSFRNKDFGVKLFAVTIPKLAFAFKNEDYMDTDLDFDCFADSGGNVIEFYTEE